MDGIVPGHVHDPLSQQFADNLGLWLQTSSSKQNMLIPTRGGSEVLSGHGTALMRQLFLEDIVPNISAVIEVAGSHPPDHYSGSSFDHLLETNQLQNPSDIMQSTALLQSMNEDQIVRDFAAWHQGMWLDRLLLHTIQFMYHDY